MTFHLQLQVFLTADLKTILDDYSQLRESGLVKKNNNFFCILYFFFFFQKFTWTLALLMQHEGYCQQNVVKIFVVIV